MRKHGLRIRLPGQPFDVLVLLLEDANHVVTREKLRAALWPGESCGGHDERLNRTMNRVREALNDCAETPRFVETIPRVGFRFLAPVERFGETLPVAAAP